MTDNKCTLGYIHGRYRNIIFIYLYTYIYVYARTKYILFLNGMFIKFRNLSYECRYLITIITIQI